MGMENLNDYLIKFNRSGKNEEMVRDVADLRLLRDELRDSIEDLVNQLKDRSEKYKEAYGRYTYYKDICKNLTEERNGLMKEVDTMSTQIHHETSAREEEMTTAKATAEWWREQNMQLHGVITDQEQKINTLREENDKNKKDVKTLKKCIDDMTKQHKRDTEGLIDSNRKNEQEIINLKDRLGNRFREMTGAKKEVAEKEKLMKKDRKQIETLKAENTTVVGRNLELEEKVTALNIYKEDNQRELDIAMARLVKITESMGPSVANKEPGPQNEVERTEPIVQEPHLSLPETNDTESMGPSVANKEPGPQKGVERAEPIVQEPLLSLPEVSDTAEDKESPRASEEKPQRERKKNKSDKSSEESQTAAKQSRNELKRKIEQQKADYEGKIEKLRAELAMAKKPPQNQETLDQSKDIQGEKKMEEDMPKAELVEDEKPP